MKGNEAIGFIKCREVLAYLSDYCFLGKVSTPKLVRTPPHLAKPSHADI
jgi:hypothetical protein